MNRKHTAILVIICLILTIFTGCGNKEVENGIVGKINDREITKEEFDQYYKVTLNSYGVTEEQLDTEVDGENMLESFKKDVLEELVQMEIIKEYVVANEMEVDTTETDASVEQYLAYIETNDDAKKFMTDNNITNEFITEIFTAQAYANAFFDSVITDIEDIETLAQAYYAENSELYQIDEIRASHILVSDQAIAADILKGLTADNFAEMAKEKSEGPSGPNGGDLGYFGRGRMVQDFEIAAFELEVGEISGVVPTQFGYHIILKTDERSMTPYEEVYSQIVGAIYDEKYQAQIKEVSKDMTVERYEDNI